MTDTIEKDSGLMPMAWQNGDVAISKTHFYMIYNDPKEGVTVHWNNKITNESDKRHNFESRDDARSWIKDIHHQAMREKYAALASKVALENGQRWAHKIEPRMIIEIVALFEDTAHTKTYSNERPEGGILVKNNILFMQNFLSQEYHLMTDGETIEQCLARCEAAA